MNKEFDNDMRGVMFKNKDKNEDHPNWPNYNGSCEIEGKEYWLAAWVKTAKSGKKFLSIAFKPKEAKATEGEVAEPDAEVDVSDMPF